MHWEWPADVRVHADELAWTSTDGSGRRPTWDRRVGRVCGLESNPHRHRQEAVTGILSNNGRRRPCVRSSASYVAIWIAFVSFWVMGFDLGHPISTGWFGLVSCRSTSYPTGAHPADSAYWQQLIDPVPLSLLMLATLMIVAWALAGLVTWLAK